MGSNDEMENESPVHKVSVKVFWMDAYKVTVEEFEEFAEETEYNRGGKIGMVGGF